MLTAEQGKPLAEAAMEVFASAIWCQYYADLETPRQVIQDDDEALRRGGPPAVGVVAAITPWNFPLTLAFWKIAPALLAGNTMVLKPSPYTPSPRSRWPSCCATCSRPGVLNVVSGGDQLGAWMTGHPVPARWASPVDRTGKLVARSAAPDLKRVTLELGGNDPAIVLDDADPAEVGREIFAAAFANNGQVCSAVKRVYVPEARYDDVLEGMTAQRPPSRWATAPRRTPSSGRSTTRRSSSGSRSWWPTPWPTVPGPPRGQGHGRPGYFFEPTILADVTDGTRIVDEEQFGPALPVIAYRDVDDVVERANATHFGLSGSVWGGTSERAAEVAGQLECGTAWVNTHLALGPSQPFGGSSGAGSGSRTAVGTRRVHRGPGGVPGAEGRRAQPRHAGIFRRRSPRGRTAGPGRGRWARQATALLRRRMLVGPHGHAGGAAPALGTGRQVPIPGRPASATFGDEPQTLTVAGIAAPTGWPCPPATGRAGPAADPLFHGSGSDAAQQSAYWQLRPGRRRTATWWPRPTPSAGTGPWPRLDPDGRPALRGRIESNLWSRNCVDGDRVNAAGISLGLARSPPLLACNPADHVAAVGRWPPST